MRPLAIVMLIAATAGDAAAQALAEVRIADSRYRFVDVSFTAKSGAVFDAFYVGVPGSNEWNVGGGYTFKRNALTLVPLLYAVVGKEGGQRGVKAAALASFEDRGWKCSAFLGAFLRASGSTDSYQLLDTADFTRTFATSWEAGAQAGFFRAGGAWNMQLGPLLKRNDAHGAWAASYRWGSPKEFRVGRVILF